MFNKSGFICVGTLIKTHGINGSLQLKSEEVIPDEIEEMELVFVDIDNGLVPFFFNDCEIKTDSTAIVSFDYVQTQDAAKKLTGLDVYIPAESFTLDNTKSDTIVGFQAFDEHKGLLGEITGVVTYSLNELFDIDNGRLLIPFNEEWIVEINEEQRKISFSLPEGLINL